MTKQEANKTWWYRLIKVIFILSIFISILIPILVFIEYKPELNAYQSRFSLKCDDGRIKGDFDNSDLKYNLTSFNDSQYNKDRFNLLDKMAKSACYYKETGDALKYIINSGNYYVPPDKNYEIIVSKSVYYHSWLETICYTLLSILIIVIFFNLIRAIFCYIVFSENFWNNFVSLFKWIKELKK